MAITAVRSIKTGPRAAQVNPLQIPLWSFIGNTQHTAAVRFARLTGEFKLMLSSSGNGFPKLKLTSVEYRDLLQQKPRFVRKGVEIKKTAEQPGSDPWNKALTFNTRGILLDPAREHYVVVRGISEGKAFTLRSRIL
jgi:hypothetical protein